MGLGLCKDTGSVFIPGLLFVVVSLLYCYRFALICSVFIFLWDPSNQSFTTFVTVSCINTIMIWIYIHMIADTSKHIMQLNTLRYISTGKCKVTFWATACSLGETSYYGNNGAIKLVHPCRKWAKLVVANDNTPLLLMLVE